MTFCFCFRISLEVMKMNLYNLCLKNILFRNVITTDLPLSIKNELNKLILYKKLLQNFKTVLALIEEKNEKIDDMRYNLEQIENGLLWGNSYYEEYEEIENEIEREEQQKQDLELWLGNCESDVVDARNDIEHDFSSKIDSKILRHLEHIYQF